MSGCVNTPVNECAWVEIIILNKSDVLTRPTKEAILEHNELVTVLCKRT